MAVHAGTHTPITRDLRAHSTAVKRERKQKQKYYSYRAVHPSWIGQEYYTVVPTTSPTAQPPNSRNPTTIPFQVSMHLDHHQCCPTWACFEKVPRADSLVPKIALWTKHDNFADKDTFPTPGPDRRHSRGRRTVRELYSQGWDLQKLGRRQKQKDNAKRELDEEHDAHVQKLDEDNGCDVSCPCMRGVFGWFPDEDAVQDVYNKCLRIGDVFRGQKISTGLGAWDEEPPEIWDIYDYDDYDEDYEDYEEYEEEEEESHVDKRPVWETISLLESLLSSSAVVVADDGRSDDQDSLLSYDRISRFEDAIIDAEWDVVSDAS